MITRSGEVHDFVEIKNEAFYINQNGKMWEPTKLHKHIALDKLP